LDPPKVGHQGVIKMIKVHFHSGNIRVIIFHKFGKFIPAKEHLFKVLRVRCSILILLLKLFVVASFVVAYPTVFYMSIFSSVTGKVDHRRFYVSAA
jgi:hypothetical protein